MFSHGAVWLPHADAKETAAMNRNAAAAVILAAISRGVGFGYVSSLSPSFGNFYFDGGDPLILLVYPILCDFIDAPRKQVTHRGAHSFGRW